LRSRLPLPAMKPSENEIASPAGDPTRRRTIASDLSE
jgi:hypothetical protein